HNTHSQTGKQASAARPSRGSGAVTNQGGQKEAQTACKSDTDPALDDSFNTKLDSLCSSLSKFSIESPTTTHSSDLASRQTDLDSPFNEGSSLTSMSLPRSEMAVVEPSLLLFVGKFYSQFLSSLSTQRQRQRFGQDGYWGGSELEDGVETIDGDTPTLLLHQGRDGETILADVFLPSCLDGRNGSSVLDLALPIIPQEAHQDAIRGVWINFVAAFPKTSDVRELCYIDEPLVVKTTVVGVSGDTDKCWTCGEGCESYKDVQQLFLKCKEEDFALTQSSTVAMRVVRASSLPARDLYICGAVPTKVDADVYHTLTSGTRDLIRDADSGLHLTHTWMAQMESRGADGIESLPSPSRILRSSRRAPPPISPLVKSETPSSSRNLGRTGAGQGTPGRKVDTLSAKQL
ncbi:hypothetical protein EGW08_013120, partial [Elysia chlorotica]